MYGKARLARYAAFVMIAVCAVAGCGGASKPNLSTVTVSTSRSTVSPSGAPSSHASSVPSVPAIPADVPRTGHNVRPGEKPPEYPASALAKTQAGANAFAEFYMKTIDWAYATTNPSYMKHYSGPTCGLCNGLATGIAKTRAATHLYEGGRFHIHDAKAEQVGEVTAPADFCSRVTVDVSAESVVDVSGNIVNGEGAATGVIFKTCFKYQSDRYTVTYLDRIS